MAGSGGRLGLWVGPLVEAARLAVRLNGVLVAGLLVQLRDVVVGRAEGLLHHDRRETALFGAADVALAERVADLVVDGVLAVRADVAAEGERAADPAGQVDHHALLGAAPARRLVLDGVAAVVRAVEGVRGAEGEADVG